MSITIAPFAFLSLGEEVDVNLEIVFYKNIYIYIYATLLSKKNPSNFPSYCFIYGPLISVLTFIIRKLLWKLSMNVILVIAKSACLIPLSLRACIGFHILP